MSDVELAETGQLPSPRQVELLDACYEYVLEHGLDVSLRPLASAVGSSPRVLLYLFGSKEDLLRAVMARARRSQVEGLRALSDATGETPEFGAVVRMMWSWLSATAQRPMVRLTYEAFLASWSRSPGPWTGFAAESAQDWLDLLIRAQPGVPADPAAVRARNALALIRGLLLDLLAGTPADEVEAAARAWRPPD